MENRKIEMQRQMAAAARRGLNVVLVANLLVLLGGLALLYCGHNGIIGVTGLWVGLVILVAALIMTVAFYFAFRRTLSQASKRMENETAEEGEAQ